MELPWFMQAGNLASPFNVEIYYILLLCGGHQFKKILHLWTVTIKWYMSCQICFTFSEKGKIVLQTQVSLKKFWCFTGDKSLSEFKERVSAVRLKTFLPKWDILKFCESFLNIMSKEQRNTLCSVSGHPQGLGKVLPNVHIRERNTLVTHCPCKSKETFPDFP